ALLFPRASAKAALVLFEEECQLLGERKSNGGRGARPRCQLVAAIEVTREASRQFATFRFNRRHQAKKGLREYLDHTAVEEIGAFPVALPGDDGSAPVWPLGVTEQG